MSDETPDEDVEPAPPEDGTVLHHTVEWNDLTVPYYEDPVNNPGVFVGRRYVPPVDTP